jgi:hypothetical protein
VAKASANGLFYGQSSGATPENLSRLQGALPFIAERHDYVEGQTFLFNGTPIPARVNDLRTQHIATPQGVEGDGWQIDQGLPLWHDTLAHGTLARWDFSGREWGLLYETSVYQLAQSDNDLIEIGADVYAPGPECGIKLVVELKLGDSTCFYRNDMIPAELGHRKLWVAVKLSDIDQHAEGMRLRAYVWNEGMKPAHVNSLTVQVREGDPWLYGFFQPMKGPLNFP